MNLPGWRCLCWPWRCWSRLAKRCDALEGHRMSSWMRFIIVYALFSAAALVITFHKDTMVPTNRPFSQFPEKVKSWQMSKRSEFSEDVIRVLKPTDYLSREYKDADGKTVSLYVGYHGGGKDGGEIHSPKHCL